MTTNDPGARGALRTLLNPLLGRRGRLRCRSGAVSIEYGLIAAGVGVAIIAAVFALGQSVAETYEAVARQLSHYTSGPAEDGGGGTPPGDGGGGGGGDDGGAQ